MTFDPHAAAQDAGTLVAPARLAFVIVPTDATPLSRVAKAVDVENISGAHVVVLVTPVGATDLTLAGAVPFGVPAGAVRTIPVRVQIVWANGIAGGVGSVAVIGYSD